ncbi:MAG: hypothetical protein CMF62_09950 [Magnetococcales bacterium]|nr:hypothetical protein [Magnetococcales bacterium]|tara:strand:- start:303070 stop:303291 length:222 start_codon:yes stop_codon:yes gene_type:complete
MLRKRKSFLGFNVRRDVLIARFVRETEALRVKAFIIGHDAPHVLESEEEKREREKKILNQMAQPYLLSPILAT